MRLYYDITPEVIAEFPITNILDEVDRLFRRQPEVPADAKIDYRLYTRNGLRRVHPWEPAEPLPAGASCVIVCGEFEP